MPGEQSGGAQRVKPAEHVSLVRVVSHPAAGSGDSQELHTTCAARNAVFPESVKLRSSVLLHAASVCTGILVVRQRSPGPVELPV